MSNRSAARLDNAVEHSPGFDFCRHGHASSFNKSEYGNNDAIFDRCGSQ
jgi:hypothetical protein